jgi:hypothetical protein
MANHEQLAAHGKEIIQAAPQLYFDVDVEADGIAGYGSLLSVGAISPWGETYYSELRPTSERFIESNRAFCEAHNLERERLMDEGQNPDEAMKELSEWVGDVTDMHEKSGAVFSAFNASFDFPWVDLAMHEARLKNPFGIAGYCIKSLANQLPGNHYDWRQTAKGRLPAEIVPEGDFTHNALEDAVYQQKIHNALVGKLNMGYEMGIL